MTSNVRYRYIENQVLQLYKQMPCISFPIDIISVFRLFSNYRISTYQEFAKEFNTSVQDVISMCESRDGSTHYEAETGKYLTLYNNPVEDPLSIYVYDEIDQLSGRKLWTVAHELGHIILGHLSENSLSMVAQNNFVRISDPVLEREADFFAATLLSPLPICKIKNIKSLSDIRLLFGLSHEASENRYNEYLKYKQSAYKTSFANDLIAVITSNKNH